MFVSRGDYCGKEALRTYPVGSSVDSAVGEGIDRGSLSCPQPDEQIYVACLCLTLQYLGQVPVIVG